MLHPSKSQCAGCEPHFTNRENKVGRDNRQHLSSGGAHRQPKPGRDDNIPFPAHCTAWKTEGLHLGNRGGGTGSHQIHLWDLACEGGKESSIQASPCESWGAGASQCSHIKQVWVCFGCAKLGQAVGRGDGETVTSSLLCVLCLMYSAVGLGDLWRMSCQSVGSKRWQGNYC